jgi:hypothetical protein
VLLEKEVGSRSLTASRPRCGRVRVRHQDSGGVHRTPETGDDRRRRGWKVKRAGRTRSAGSVQVLALQNAGKQQILVRMSSKVS